MHIHDRFMFLSPWKRYNSTRVSSTSPHRVVREVGLVSALSSKDSLLPAYIREAESAPALLSPYLRGYCLFQCTYVGSVLPTPRAPCCDPSPRNLDVSCDEEGRRLEGFQMSLGSTAPCIRGRRRGGEGGEQRTRQSPWEDRFGLEIVPRHGTGGDSLQDVSYNRKKWGSSSPPWKPGVLLPGGVLRIA